MKVYWHEKEPFIKLIFQKEYNMRIPIINENRNLQIWLITKDNINSDILDISYECKLKIEKLLKKDIYSIYLYWWHAQNTSNSVYSDLDLMLFFEKKLTENQKSDIIFLEKELTEKYNKNFSYVWFDLAEPYLYKNIQPQVYWLLAKSLWFKLSKNWMDNNLENPILSDNLAFQLNYDFKERINKKFLEFIHESDLFKKKLASRWICKKLLRTTFGLLINKIRFFENDIKQLELILIQFFPENKDLIIKIWKNIETPTENIFILKNIVEKYLFWLENEWDKKFYKYKLF